MEELLSWILEYHKYRAKQKFIKKKKRDKKEKKLKEHIRIVELISNLIWEEIKEKYKLSDKSIIVIKAGALLHDIEKFAELNESNIKHPQLGEIFINKNKGELLRFGFSLNEIKILARIVGEHNLGKYRLDEDGYLIENEDNKDNEEEDIFVKIIQDADKISKIYKKDADCYIEAWKSIKSNDKYRYARRKNIIDNITGKGLNFKESYCIFEKVFNEYIMRKDERKCK